MAQRQRGLGRGLGALIPSAQSEETIEHKGSVSRETGAQRNNKDGAQSQKAEKLESKAANKAATGGRQGQKSAKPKADGSTSNRTSKPSVASEEGKKEGQSKATTEKAATPRPAKTSARSSVTGSSDVSRGTSKKNKAPRADMGAALRASRTGGRATDVFFQTTQAQQTAEQHSETSQTASSSREPEVSRETEAGTADASQQSEAALRGNDTTPQKSAKSEVLSERVGQGNEISASRETAAEDAESISEQSGNKAAEESNGSVSRGTSTTDLPQGDEGPGSSPDQEPEARKEAERPSDDGNTLVPVPGAFFGEIKVGDIHPNRKQPRQEFDEDEMEELVHSIKEIGVLQPIVIRPSREENDAKYELVMGERRWRATQRAGLSVIPAIVRETQDVDLLRDALLENLHRSQLNPLEEAAAYQQLLHEFGTTQDELAQRIGRSRPQISNTIRLLKLPPLVQRRVAAGILSAGHARALLGLSDPAAMERLAQRIVAEGLSVRSVEEIVQSGGAESGKKAPRKPTPATKHHERFDYIADAFADKLDTNVKINVGARKGKMTIEFASVDDLNRIISVLDPEIERN